MEQSVSDIKDQLVEHEERMGRFEERLSTAEDTERRHHRTLKYLLHRDIELSAKCEDLQNRLRRNNIRIFQIPEDSEGRDMAGFVKDQLQKELKLAPDLVRCWERLKDGWRSQGRRRSGALLSSADLKALLQEED